MEIIFIQLAVLLITAFVVSYIAKILKQPITVGYIVAGIVISPLLVYFGEFDENTIKIFSEIGIAFLLFMVGLHLNPKVIKDIGAKSLFVAIGEILIVSSGGFLLSYYFFNFNLTTSIFIGIALSFSSTIIVTKLLSDKDQLDSLYGKISIGILIVQDFVAVGALMFLTSPSLGRDLFSFAIRNVFGGLGLIVLLFTFSYIVLGRWISNLAKSSEMLFLFSLTWAFSIAALFNALGFSVEIGALVAGVTLSIFPYSLEISSKIKPLRDFFIIIFFIILGLNLGLTPISRNSLIFAGVLATSVLVLKPLIIMILMSIVGYTKRTNFMTSISLSQISEFSIILMNTGIAAGKLDSELGRIMTLVSILTIVISTYLFKYSETLFSRLKRILIIFERKSVRERRRIKRKYDVILFGYNRTGFSILRTLKNMGKSYLVVDFDPDTIRALSKAKIPCVYGDAGDSDFLEDLPIKDAKIIISTIPDTEANELIFMVSKLYNPKAIIILRASSVNDAISLYKKGANYVMIPQILGGEYISTMIKKNKTNPEKYKNDKNRSIKIIKEIIRKELGDDES